MAKDDEKPPRFKVVSGNPDLPNRAQREAAERADWDRRIAEQALADLAVTILRTLAGSNTAAIDVMRHIHEYIMAYGRLHETTGRGLTIADEQKVLSLKEPAPEGSDEYQRRRALIEDAYDTIVKGALRLAAHRVRGEDPHFGGKYSTDLIDAGIRDLQEAREWRRSPPPRILWEPRPRSKKPPPRSGEKVAPATPPPKQRPMLKDPTGGKSKRWSPMDSKSWRDMKKEE
jgi:hypothetical protein